MWKKARNAFLIILAVILAYWAYLTFVVSDNSTNAYQLIPDDAVYIFHTQKPLKKWKGFSATELWQHMKGYPKFEEIAESANEIDKTLEEHKLMLKVFALKDLYVSAHVHRPGDYEFLFLTDLAKVSKSSFITENLDQLFKVVDYQVSTQNYLGTTVYKCYDEEDKETLYVSVLGNYLACSYNLGILKKSIKSYNEPKLTKNEKFNEIVKWTSASGDAELYLNYSNLTQFLRVYLSEVDLGLQELIQQTYFTGMSARLKDNDILLEGKTTINDSLDRIFSILSRAGNSALKVDQILSNQTSLYLRVGFEKFDRFFQASLKLSSEQARKKSNRNIKIIELLLGFSLKEDFLSWIGNEIVVAQLGGEEVNTNASLVVLRTSNKDEAQDKLESAFKQIRRRLPYKMNGEEFEGYQIRRLETKGLFRTVFGKMFDKVQRPYFCFVDDYVVFCDDILNIKKVIRDFEDGNVLSKQKEYLKVKKHLNHKNAFTAYLNSNLYYQNFNETLNASSYQEMQNNMKYVRCFNGLGISLKATDAGVFDTKIRNNFQLP